MCELKHQRKCVGGSDASLSYLCFPSLTYFTAIFVPSRFIFYFIVLPTGILVVKLVLTVHVLCCCDCLAGKSLKPLNGTNSVPLLLTETSYWLAFAGSWPFDGRYFYHPWTKPMNRWCWWLKNEQVGAVSKPTSVHPPVSKLPFLHFALSLVPHPLLSLLKSFCLCALLHDNEREKWMREREERQKTIRANAFKIHWLFCLQFNLEFVQ